MGGHVPSLPWPGWVVRFAQIQRVFWRGRVGAADSTWAWRYTVYLLWNWTHHANAFVHCPLSTPDPIGALPPGPCWRTSFSFTPRPPPVLCPWIPLGDFLPQTPSALPTSKILATPLADSTRFTVFTWWWFYLYGSQLAGLVYKLCNSKAHTKVTK